MNVEEELKRVIGSYDTEEDLLHSLQEEKELVWALHLHTCWVDKKALTKKFFMENYPFNNGKIQNLYHKNGEFIFSMKFEYSEHLYTFESGRVFELFGAKLWAGGWAGYYYGQYKVNEKLFKTLYRKHTKDKLTS